MPDADISNARHPEQIKKMEGLLKNGQCYFCREGFENRHNAPIILETSFWFISANTYPYDGSVHHYLIIPKVHIKKASEISAELSVTLFESISWLENYLQAIGYSILVRSGDTRTTGATLEHLHFHFVVGGRKTEDSPNKLEDLIIAPVGFKKKTDPKSALG
jgi:diadenosine tetraphosphate (Ap4A) HIT family hydrolase